MYFEFDMVLHSAGSVNLCEAILNYQSDVFLHRKRLSRSPWPAGRLWALLKSHDIRLGSWKCFITSLRIQIRQLYVKIGELMRSDAMVISTRSNTANRFKPCRLDVFKQ